MTKTDISNEIIKVLENFGIAPKAINPNTSFVNDLELDSLDFAELILTVEQIFDISISFNNDNIHTIDELVNTIENILNSNLLKNHQS